MSCRWSSQYWRAPSSPAASTSAAPQSVPRLVPAFGGARVRSGGRRHGRHRRRRRGGRRGQRDPADVARHVVERHAGERHAAAGAAVQARPLDGAAAHPQRRQLVPLAGLHEGVDEAAAGVAGEQLRERVVGAGTAGVGRALGIAADEPARRLRGELGRVGGDDREPVLERDAADLAGVRDVGEGRRIGAALEIRADRAQVGLQHRRTAARRQRSRSRVRRSPGATRCSPAATSSTTKAVRGRPCRTSVDRGDAGSARIHAPVLGGAREAETAARRRRTRHSACRARRTARACRGASRAAP